VQALRLTTAEAAAEETKATEEQPCEFGCGRGRLFSAQGLRAHMRDAHPEGAAKPPPEEEAAAQLQLLLALTQQRQRGFGCALAGGEKRIACPLCAPLKTAPRLYTPAGVAAHLEASHKLSVPLHPAGSFTEAAEWAAAAQAHAGRKGTMAAKAAAAAKAQEGDRQRLSALRDIKNQSWAPLGCGMDTDAADAQAAAEADRRARRTATDGS
jgi:hypothetical protein